MNQLYETQSFVSVDAAWHQELSFEETCSITLSVENLGTDPIYGFYLNENDFNFMIEHESANDQIMARIQKQLLCENEYKSAETDVVMQPGKYYICCELDCSSSPDANRTDFIIRIFEK